MGSEFVILPKILKCEQAQHLSFGLTKKFIYEDNEDKGRDKSCYETIEYHREFSQV